MRELVAIVAALLLAGRISAETQQKAVERGEHLYNTVCWTCHGRYGRGDGPAADELVRKPPDFTLPGFLASRSDDQILGYLTASEGDPDARHTPMAVASALKEDAFRDALLYIRTLAVPGQHVSIKAGRDIYESFCWVCHGVDGDGKGPAAENIGEVKPRDFTSDDFVIEGREKEVYRTISVGAAESFHGAATMLEWGTTLSPQQIQDVIAYLKTFKKK